MRLEARRGGALDYVVRSPRRAPGEALAPVLCFLHGHDEGAPTPLEEGVARHGPLRLDAATGSEAFLVIAPQLPRQGDFWLRHARDVEAIVRAEQAAQRGDPSRTYLTGFSFGGNGVFDLAAEFPGTWAALWAVDPTRVPVEPIAAPAWLSIGSAARSATRLFVHRLGLVDAARGAPGARAYLDEDADHVGSATRAYADTRVYHWLLEHALTP
jgi:poly(3-hydroxybutyrate) depolymerase